MSHPIGLSYMDRKELQHLLSRAAFGMSVQHLQRYEDKTRLDVVDDLFAQSKVVTHLDVDLAQFFNEAKQLAKGNKKDLVALIKNSKDKLLELNAQWMDYMMSSDAELQERMTLFWTNHFVCKDRNVYHMELYLNMIREHALGNFGSFVKAVSKQPAMLKYLNGRQNRKSSPNENFARELMELFTLGEGHYSEYDIREAARAFTGYSHDFKGNFIFRRAQHDKGQKYVLGESGYFQGDDIIDVILKRPQCAKFLCTKLFTYFVNPIPNSAHINEMVRVFSKDFEISTLMRFLFMQDWFYAEENRGVKIKSPADLLASAYRKWPFKFDDHRSYIKVQKLLGQELLNPPNVAGWPGDQSWIDTNTLMVRLKLPSLIYNMNLETGGSVLGVKGKRKNPMAAFADRHYAKFNYKSLSYEALIDTVLTGSFYDAKRQQTIEADSIPLTLVRLMSLPEFQMA